MKDGRGKRDCPFRTSHLPLRTSSRATFPSPAGNSPVFSNPGRRGRAAGAGKSFEAGRQKTAALPGTRQGLSTLPHSPVAGPESARREHLRCQRTGCAHSAVLRRTGRPLTLPRLAPSDEKLAAEVGIVKRNPGARITAGSLPGRDSSSRWPPITPHFRRSSHWHWLRQPHTQIEGCVG